MRCPRCGKNYATYPAISRRDNKTEICSKCGTEEAMIDFGMISKDYKELEFLEKIKNKAVVVSHEKIRKN